MDTHCLVSRKFVGYKHMDFEFVYQTKNYFTLRYHYYIDPGIYKCP